MFDEFRGIGGLGGSVDPVRGDVSLPVGDVVEDRVVEQKRFLRDDRHLAADGLHRDRAQVPAVDPDSAGRRVEESRQQAHQGCLPCSAEADQGDDVSGADSQADVIQRGLARVAGVRETHTVELDHLLDGGQGLGPGGILDVVGMIHVCEGPLHRPQGLLEDVVDSDQALDGLQQHDEGDDEAHHLAGRQPARQDPPAHVDQQTKDHSRP